jgi:hypothetical protein
MDRRTLIKSAAVLAAPAIVTNARAQSVTTLRFHTFVPAMSNAYSRLIGLVNLTPYWRSESW